MLKRQQLVALALLLCLVGWVAYSYFRSGVIAELFSTDLTSQAKLAAVQDYFHSWGPLAPIVYTLVVIVEVVVAPLPGLILYLPGGMIFGGFWGGLLSVLGNVLGAGLSCTLIRTIAGQKATAGFFAEGSLEKYRKYLEGHGTAIIALLRINPLTSSDLVSYAAGLSPIPVWKVMLGTTLGMTPICFAQAYLSREIFTAMPWLIWPLSFLCVVYAIMVCRVIIRLRNR